MKQRRLSPNDGGNGITEGVIWKQLLLFFFPILLGTFFQQLYNTADAIIVGKFVGKEALAAVGGATGNLINLLVGFFVGLSSGASVIIFTQSTPRVMVSYASTVGRHRHSSSCAPLYFGQRKGASMCAPSTAAPRSQGLSFTA